ncbi:acyl-CoA dehydrogenase [Aeromicrobium fastidiosum]|nr:acyl-CoA dehydrogenase [Aeromicrobium fastidiosum]
MPAELFRTLGDQGFLGTDVPDDLGGSGTGDPRFTAVLVEEVVAAGAIGLAVVLAHQCGVAVPAVLRLPEGDHRTTTIRRVAAGEDLLIPLLLDGGDRGLGVPGAAGAGFFVVVQSGPDGEAGVSLVARDAVEVTAGSASLGGLEAGLGDVRLAVPAATVDGSEVERVRRDVDLWTAVVSAAGARHALELGRAYVVERKVFGRPLSSLENTRLRLAEVGARIGVVQGFVTRCLDELADGTLSGVAAATARMEATRAFDRAVDQSLQLHGGYGYMREYPISHAYADARFVRQSAAASSDPRLVLADALGL